MNKLQILLCLSILYAVDGIAQNVGIGTQNPAARLHVTDSSVLFSAMGEVADNPGTPPVSGSGRRMMWYADKAAFRVGSVNGDEWNMENIGNHSIGMGYSPLAYGQSAVALGFNAKAYGVSALAVGSAIAQGDFSLAIGFSPIAQGFSSTAIGRQALASGDRAIALGSGTEARARSSIALGMYNNSIIASNPFVDVPTDPLFIIGNGQSDFDRRNAIMVLKNGNMGIGTNTPNAKLHIGSGSFAASGPGFADAEPDNPPVSGAGRRLMWHFDKAAFRTGYVSGVQWDHLNIGNYSFAAGYNAQAAAHVSTAIGNTVVASGANSFAAGRNVGANGNGSFVFGDNDPNGKGVRTTISDNLFWTRFNGGYYFVSSDAGTDIGVRVLSGGNSWTTISDKNLKENFALVNGEDILQKLANIPQYTWNYKGQDPESFRHYGPMAQDFYTAFGKDEYGTIGCDTLINQHDFIGVNMVAIQALEKRTTVLQQQLDEAMKLLQEARNEIKKLREKP
jgi:hypothetical protein